MKIEMYPCKCGGSAKYYSAWPMSDQFVCDSCDYKTKSYFDGAEYARDDWQHRNKPRADGQETLKFEKRR